MTIGSCVGLEFGFSGILIGALNCLWAVEAKYFAHVDGHRSFVLSCHRRKHVDVCDFLGGVALAFAFYFHASLDVEWWCLQKLPGPYERLGLTIFLILAAKLWILRFLTLAPFLAHLFTLQTAMTSQRVDVLAFDLLQRPRVARPVWKATKTPHVARACARYLFFLVRTQTIVWDGLLFGLGQNLFFFGRWLILLLVIL